MKHIHFPPTWTDAALRRAEAWTRAAWAARAELWERAMCAAFIVVVLLLAAGKFED